MSPAGLFAAALRLLPERVREEYGAEMIQAFEERCRAAAAHGRVAHATTVVHELADLAAAAIHLRHRAPESERTRMSTILNDVRHALRTLRRQPAFTAIAAGTLAIAIGVTTAVFTVVNGVLLRPLPFPEPGRLVVLLYGSARGVSPWLSPLNYRDYVAQTGVFERAAASTPTTKNFSGGGDP